jgi:hypothetical protein
MKNSVLMRSINTIYFRQNNSLILKLTSGQWKINLNNNNRIVNKPINNGRRIPLEALLFESFKVNNFKKKWKKSE